MTSRAITLYKAQYDPATHTIKDRGDVVPMIPTRRKAMSPYLMNGCPKLCAGCGQPFPIRDGRVEAQVGQDTKLYCYGTTCENDSLEASAQLKRRAN